MNLRSMVDVEIVKNERTYRLSIPVGAPYGEAYDAAHECLLAVLDMAKNGAEQAKQAKEQTDNPITIV